MPEINMSIQDGQTFFAHETSINFTPSQLTLDFKSITPRTDPRNKTNPTFVLLHNVVMLDPYHAKQVHKILGEAVKKYEADFGKIDKPKAVSKAEKKYKTMEKTATAAEVPTYMG
jgi:(p)ppGpp synthase/HD superfamily hydrolase